MGTKISGGRNKRNGASSSFLTITREDREMSYFRSQNLLQIFFLDLIASNSSFLNFCISVGLGILQHPALKYLSFLAPKKKALAAPPVAISPRAQRKKNCLGWQRLAGRGGKKRSPPSGDQGHGTGFVVLLFLIAFAI